MGQRRLPVTQRKGRRFPEFNDDKPETSLEDYSWRQKPS